MRVRIENVTLVTTDEANRVFENGCLVWEDDTILALNDFSVHVDEVIDGQGGLLLPGMVNTHCHLGMIPFRSLGDDCPDRLRRFLFPLENAAMTRELAQASARYAAAEMMLGGVTTVFDMYYFEDALAEAMDLVSTGGMTGTVLNDHINQSHKAVDCTVQAINGEKLDAYYWIDYIKVTPENVAQYK